MKMVSNFVQSETHPFATAIRAFLPQYACVALSQVKGDDYTPVVKVDDSVSEGQVIAVPSASSENVNTGADIHSPVPGKVVDFITTSLPDGKIGRAVKIRMAGSFSYLGKEQTVSDWKNLQTDELCNIFKDKGVANTFCGSTALSDQIRNDVRAGNRMLVVRLFDDDPSRMTDAFVSENYLNEVVSGACVIAKACSAWGVVFCVPQNKNLPLDFHIFDNTPVLINKVNTDYYPCGFRQNLVHSIHEQIDQMQSLNQKKQKKAARKTSPETEQSSASDMKKENSVDYEFFRKVSANSLFVDSVTCHSVYGAVMLGIPVVERFIHVTGDCLRSAGMFKVRLGTTIKDLVDQCGGFKIPPAKIVINGMLSGYSISSLDIPVTKAVKSIAFVPASQLDDQRYNDCIRCGKCRYICPEGIFPDLIFRHQTGGKPVGKEMLQTIDLCSGCCLCNCACPSRLPLAQTILLLKEMEND